MRKHVLLAAAIALAGCSRELEADRTADGAGGLPDRAMAAPTALGSLNETTWEFTISGSNKPVRESIDARGNYIAVSGKEHFDHGTAVVKDGKDCFTSAMNDKGEECWSGPSLAIGQSGAATSDTENDHQTHRICASDDVMETVGLPPCRTSRGLPPARRPKGRPAR